MTRIYHTGFEWQSFTAGHEFDTVSGTPIVENTIINGGACSMEISGNMSTGTVEGISHTLSAAQTKLYAKFDFYIDTLPNDGGATALIFDLLSAGTNVVSAQLYYNGTNISGVTYYNSFGGNLTGYTGNYSGGWHYIEILYDTTPANGSEVLTVKIDGTTVDTSSALTFTNKTVNQFQTGVYNGTAGTISTEVVYIDNIAFNNSSGTVNNSWVGAEKIAIAVPTGAGDNAATTGIYSYINEIPPSDTATSGSTMIELDVNPTNGDYAMTDSSTMGIDSYDTISAISVLARIREETAGTSNYTLRIKSASGGTTTSSASVDAGNATPRTNPNGTTAFGNSLISETDPTTGVAWTPTGTNSVDNMQVGVGTTDGTPDVWCLTLCAMVAYVDGTAPSGRRIFMVS